MGKKQPLRMCTGCGEMKPKKELIRIVRDKDGNVCLDVTGKKSGRGAYVCNSTECFENSLKTKRLERQLSIKLSNELAEQIRQEINKNV